MKKAELSQRERQILRLVVTGEPNMKIAAILGIKADTVKKTLSSAFRKLNAKNRTQAAYLFRKWEEER